jgi:hypothetical protein
LLNSGAGGRRKDIVYHISGVAHARRLEAQDLSLLIGARAMLDAAWNNQALAGVQFHYAIPEFHAETALPHQEEFVFCGMEVPGKFTLNLDDFDFLSIQAGDHFGAPVLGEEGEFLIQVYFRHIPEASVPNDPAPA